MSAFLPTAYSFKNRPDWIVFGIFDQIGGGMVHHFEARIGLGFDGVNVHVFGEVRGRRRCRSIRRRPLAFSTYGFGIETIRSGFPICHLSRSLNWRGGGMSAGLPSGAPWSTQLEMVAISASVSEGSSLNLVMPTLRSMCQGGISRGPLFP